MDLTLDEQRLIAEFRKLTPSGRDELLAAAASLLSRIGAGETPDSDTASNQCSVTPQIPSPGTEKTPIFTE